MTAHVQNSRALTKPLDTVLHLLAQNIHTLCECKRHSRLTVLEIVLHITENPGLAKAGAANHHCIHTILIKTLLGAFGRLHIAVANDRNVHLINGTPFEEYIANENRLIEYQKIYKLGLNYKCAIHNGQEYTHKVYRCFASKDEIDTPIMKLKKDKDKPDKYAGTPDHVFIDNGNIQDKLIPEKLDKEWYINRCISEYKKFTGKEYKRQE